MTDITEQDVDEFLQHFGVKGMHWGVRNDTSSSGGGRSSAPKGPSARNNPKYATADRQRDEANYGKGGVKRINDSINKGSSVKDARHREQSLDKAKRAEDGFKSFGAGAAGGIAGYFAGPIVLDGAKALAWSPLTLKVMGGLFGGAPFPVKIAAANSVVLARTVTSIADSPYARIGAKYVGASLGSKIAAGTTRAITDKRATDEFNRRNPQ